MDGEQTHGLDPRASPAAGAVAALLRTALGANLEAVYVHGSAVLGGYLPAVSDLDVLAVSGGPLSDTEIDAICSGLAGLPLPAKGLEMSVLTRAEAASPDLERPRYQVHVALASDGALRRVDGLSGAGDRDLVLHLAVCRAASHAVIGLPPASTLGAIPRAAIRGAMAGEIAWASEAGRLAYLVLTAARACAHVRAHRPPGLESRGGRGRAGRVGR